MTRKSTLIQWGYHLGVASDAHQAQEMTMAALEQGISEALVSRDRLISGDSEPAYNLRDAVVNNWQVIKAELPSTARAIASNLFS
ncbi:MAG: hypothetical protein HC824_06895 [Synechococcales cyanobacterium RM1_1_8]|nr:hypothetical protein [Synechococcales cyanobacterium RM1_1_8]